VAEHSSRVWRSDRLGCPQATVTTPPVATSRRWPLRLRRNHRKVNSLGLTAFGHAHETHLESAAVVACTHTPHTRADVQACQGKYSPATDAAARNGKICVRATRAAGATVRPPESALGVPRMQGNTLRHDPYGTKSGLTRLRVSMPIWRMNMRPGDALNSACPSGGQAQPPPFTSPSGPEATYAATMRFAPAVVQACAGVTWRQPRAAQQCSPECAPRGSLTGVLWPFADARMSPLCSRGDEVRPGRRAAGAPRSHTALTAGRLAVDAGRWHHTAHCGAGG
jgi:hypothetical protein